MQFKLVLVKDHLTPNLRARIGRVKDRVKLHEVMGVAICSLTKRAFNDESKRPHAWPAKSDGTPARLRKTGTLAKSIAKPLSVSSSHALVGSDRHYAAIHQLGGQTPARVIRAAPGKALKIPGIGFRKSVKHPGSKIPARPFFPFTKSGALTPMGKLAVQRVVRAALKP